MGTNMKAGSFFHKQKKHPMALTAKQSPTNKTDNADVNDANTHMPDYFSSNANRAADKRASQVLTNKIHNALSIFSGIGYFEDMFSLQVKETSWPYQASLEGSICSPRPLKEELERLQKQQIIVPLGMTATSGWCNSLLLGPKTNSKVRLCLDLARFYKKLIRLVHKSPTLNVMLSYQGVYALHTSH